MAVAEPSPAEVEGVLAVLARPDEELQEIVRLAADLCDADAAGLTVHDDEEYHIPVAVGIPPTVVAARETFCQYTMTTEGTYFVEDAPSDERFATPDWVKGAFGRTRFYGSAPVYAPGGAMVGRLCVIDDEPRVLTPLQERALGALGAAATRVIELRLAEARPPEPETPDDLRLMSRLAAELSHDMRVPLASIQASVEMLQEELGHADPAVRMLLDRASTAADRMHRMLEQILHFGAIDDHPDVADVDLAALVGQLVADSTVLLEDADATVEVADLPVVRGDADELYSLFQNLLTNSVKFVRPGVPPLVRITAERRGPHWRVCVRDNGVGIAPDRRQEVFGLFSRGDHASEGYGIGLATVARIVAAHGGRVGVDEAAEGGAEVWCELLDAVDARTA